MQPNSKICLWLGLLCIPDITGEAGGASQCDSIVGDVYVFPDDIEKLYTTACVKTLPCFVIVQDFMAVYALGCRYLVTVEGKGLRVVV